MIGAPGTQRQTIYVRWTRTTGQHIATGGINVANSTQLITDLHTLAGSTFTAASLTKAHATDNIDLAGIASTAAAAGADLKRALKLMAANLDTADAALTLTNNILGTLS